MQGARLFLFFTWRQWLVAMSIAAAGTAVCLPWYGFISPWIGCTIFLTAIILVHLHYAGQYIAPLPHIALLVAALQYIFAAWFSLYHPHDNPIYFIGDRLPLYYAYTGPVILAMTIGFAASLWRVGLPRIQPQSVSSDPSLLLELDVICLLGIASVILGNLSKIGGLAFLFVLLGNLRFVGVYGRMVLGGSGWQWRLALVLCLEVLFATASAMFHNLLLWLLWTFALWVYRFRPRMWATLGSIAIAVLLLPALQAAKWQLRTEALDPIEGLPTEIADTSVFDRTIRWVSYLVPSLQQTVMFELEDEFVSEMGMRYNQGWIINRVMLFTPDYEPYAQGKTLVSAIEASLLPRLIVEEKAKSGGRENMEKFTGLALDENTSMNLGFAGEMYANFGETGGIIGCGIYALFFGLLFRIICKRAFTNPLWWCLVPFIFYSAVKAEDDIAFVLNWTVKGSIVVAFIILALPNFRRALFRPLEAPTNSVLLNRESADEAFASR
ncbi:MAG: hypothetical protein DLM73_14525 [Chthoniobacterales bacterium]|nr:MAG: hypothetical protein DLM73_14525 [Chthoniobacterales bacterium]